MKIQSFITVLMISMWLTACGGPSGSESPEKEEIPDTQNPDTENPDTENPDSGTSEPEEISLEVDSAITNENSDGVIIHILANDQGITPAVRDTLAITSPEQGTAIINDDGTVTYQPNTDYYGEDRFTYSVIDLENEAGYETVVTITVNPVTTLTTAITYPSPNTLRNFGGAASLQVRGQIMNQDGSPAIIGDITKVNINDTQAALNEQSHWQAVVSIGNSSNVKLNVTTQALDGSESSAEAMISNEAVLQSLRRIAYAGNDIVYIVDEYNNDALIKSDLSVAYGHQTVLVDNKLDDDGEYDIRDVSWDAANNRVILAIDINGLSDTAKVISVDPVTGQTQLLFHDPDDQRYAALEWIGDNQFIAIAGSESTSTGSLIHVDLSNPESVVKTVFEGHTAISYGDITFYEDRIYLAHYYDKAVLSMALPSGHSTWQDYSVVTGTSGSETKGFGPNLGKPRALVALDSFIYVGDHNDVLKIDITSGERSILNEDFGFIIGIDAIRDEESSQLLVSDDSHRAIYEVDVDIDDPQLMLKAINRTGSGPQSTNNESRGLANGNANTVYMTDDNQIFSISLINGDREYLPVSLPNDSRLTELVFDEATHFLYASDYALKSIYKIDLSDLENITYSTLASGDLVHFARDMVLTKVFDTSYLLVTNDDGLTRINTETGALENIEINAANMNDIFQIEIKGSYLYVIQSGFDGILKYTLDESGCYCNREDLSISQRPVKLSISDDNTTAYFTDSFRRVYEMDIATGGYSELSQPEDNVIILRSPSSLMLVESEQKLIIADSHVRGILEKDLVSGQISVISQ